MRCSYEGNLPPTEKVHLCDFALLLESLISQAGKLGDLVSEPTRVPGVVTVVAPVRP